MGASLSTSLTPTMITVIAAIALALFAILVWALWRRAGPQRLFVTFMMFLVGAFALCMLVVTIGLVAKTWSDMGPSSLAASAAQPSASAPPHTGAPPPEPKDAVANAMTAIGLTIAVVTLILTLGTSWFALQIDRVSRMKRSVKKELRRLQTAAESARLEHEARVLVADVLPRAKMALHEWFVKSGESESAGALALDFSLWLEMLAASALDIRFEAFGHLRVLGSVKGQESLLEPVVKYTICCHDLAVKRLELDVSSSSRAFRDQLESGLWCKVFDRVEQARYFALTDLP